MSRDEAIQTLSNVLNSCVVNGGIFGSTNDVIVAHNALIVLAQMSEQPQEPVVNTPPANTGGGEA